MYVHISKQHNFETLNNSIIVIIVNAEKLKINKASEPENVSVAKGKFVFIRL